MALPLIPPNLFDRTGFATSILIFIPGPTVLIKDKQSAPASSQVFAISVISVTFGVNFAMIGTSAASFEAETIVWDKSQL